MSDNQPVQPDQPKEPEAESPADENAEKLTQEVGWSIDKGQVRPTNEDSLAAVTLNQASEATSQSLGVYAVADDRTYLIDAPEENVRLVIVTSGTGASTGFGIAERVIGDLFSLGKEHAA